MWGLVTVVVLVAIVAALVWSDRRSRRRGHRFRRSGDIWKSQQDVKRNLRASQETFLGPPVDKDWNKPDDQRYRRR